MIITDHHDIGCHVRAVRVFAAEGPNMHVQPNLLNGASPAQL